MVTVSPTPRPTTDREAILDGYPHPIAFAIQIGRNLIVQALGLTMVSLMELSVLPWAFVVGWTVVAVAAIGAEHRLLRVIASGGRFSAAAGAWAPALRFLITSIYALAAFLLTLRGGPGERLFAFSLMSASVVHVLMRYYRSPRIMAACIAPYGIVLVILGCMFARKAFELGHPLAALGTVFAAATFAIQFWSARAQLAGAWTELMGAREAAEERARAAAAANRAKSQFLATMSHELRTPLNGVLGMVQALGADELTGLQRDRVDVIRRSSESLLAVLNDLLDLSKIEASVLKLELVEFDLEHLIRGCAAAYRPLAEKKGLSFDFQIAGDVRGRYRGDSARIRRILYSLADNAVKFTEAGGVTLWVTREQGRTVFRICDTGIGISRGDLGRLFEGFFQADATLARRYGGAGIGLAICSELAGLMGGAVQAWSEPGRGSTFTLDLPLERVREALPDDVGDARAAPRRPSELRVLAAEDNPVNQLVLKTLLEPAGITPTLVLNGRDAVAAWESQPWDVILMDIQMPEMDGVEAARIIRQRERDTGRARTPIVAVTANAMTHQLVEYEAAGMDGVVAKPVDCASLLQAIERALAGGDPKQIAAA